MTKIHININRKGGLWVPRRKCLNVLFKAHIETSLVQMWALRTVHPLALFIGAQRPPLDY